MCQNVISYDLASCVIMSPVIMGLSVSMQPAIMRLMFQIQHVNCSHEATFVSM